MTQEYEKYLNYINVKEEPDIPMVRKHVAYEFDNR